MGKLKDYLVKKAQDYNDDELKDKQPHSHAYHAWFRGYSERRVPGKGKMRRIERIYTADYLKYDETDQMWTGKKGYYLLIYMVAAALFLYGTSRPSALNTVKAIGVMEILGMLPLVYLGYTLLFQLTARRQMTLGSYAVASTHFKWAALGTACYSALVLAVMLVWNCLSGFCWSDLAVMISLLCTALLLLLLFRLEHQRETVRVKNPAEVPRDAVEIW